jgi:hypothetical protein
MATSFGENEKCRVLDEFVCEAIWDKSLPEFQPPAVAIGRGENERIRVAEEPGASDAAASPPEDAHAVASSTAETGAARRRIVERELRSLSTSELRNLLNLIELDNAELQLLMAELHERGGLKAVAEKVLEELLARCRGRKG